MKRAILFFLLLSAGVPFLSAQTDTVIKITSPEGNVGINEPAPDKPFVVRGETEIDGDTSITGDLEIGTIDTPNNLGVIGNGEISGNLNVGSLTVNGVSNSQIPVGAIIMWSGDVNQLPSGWELCDGSSYTHAVDGVSKTIQTPDLQGMFIVGYSEKSNHPPEYKTNNRGQNPNWGKKEIKISTENLPRHRHTGITKNGEGNHEHTGGSHSHGYSRPPRSPKTAGTGEDRTSYAYVDYEGATTTGTGGHTHDGGDHQHTFTTDYAGGVPESQITPIDNRPPFYVLAFIIKVYGDD